MPREQRQPEVPTDKPSSAFSQQATATLEAPPAPPSQTVAPPMPAAPAAPPDPTAWQKTEQQFVVTFLASGDSTHESKVYLRHNCERFECDRGKPVVVRQRFLTVADDGTYIKWRQQPGEALQIAQHLQHYTARVHRVATAADLAQWAEKRTVTV